MNKPPTHASLASGLSRRSVGLSPAHIALIKLLAEIDVEHYLREYAMAEVDGTVEPADDKEMAR